MFYPWSKNLSEAEFKNNELISLVDSISKQYNIQTASQAAG